MRRLARFLRQFRPDIVLTHFPKESDGLFGQHAVAGQIVMHAIQLAISVDPGDRRAPHRMAQVFFFGQGAAALPRNVWDAQRGYYNEVFIDTTDVIDKKLAAMDCLVSQGYGGAYARKRIETGDGAFGTAARVPYAEGFIKAYAETHYHLPLTEHALKLACMSDHEIIDLESYRYRERETQ